MSAANLKRIDTLVLFTAAMSCMSACASSDEAEETSSEIASRATLQRDGDNASTRASPAASGTFAIDELEHDAAVNAQGGHRVFSGGDGILYGIKPNGDLLWYRHFDPGGGSNSWSANSGTKIGTGWSDFSSVLGNGDGVIYAIQPNGDLLWYRHLDPWVGSNSWAFATGVKIGSGWNTFSAVVAGSNGILYGIRPNGDLLWYRHLDPLGGSNSWAANSGAKIGSGWNIFAR